MTITVGGSSITFPDATTQTTAGGAVNTTTVLAATAGASVGAVGTYAFLGANSTTDYSAGGTTSGSNLRYAGLGGNSSTWTNNLMPALSLCGSIYVGTGNGGTPSGTWRCMGRAGYGGFGMSGATLWLRIS